jgi:colicin import membrane protein
MKKTSKNLTCVSFCLLALGATPFAAFAQANESAVKTETQSPAQVQTYTIEPLKERYPTDSIQSQEAASAALADVQDARDKIEARYAADQHACYPKFFTTSCLDKVTERRRLDLAEIRPIEVEANAYLRKAKVVERDRKLAEKAAQNEADAAERAKQGEQKAIVTRDKQISNESRCGRQGSAASKACRRCRHASRPITPRANSSARHVKRKRPTSARSTKKSMTRSSVSQKYDKRTGCRKESATRT